MASRARGERVPSFFVFPHRGIQARRDPCCFCGGRSGHLAGRIDYIGLAVLDMLQCPRCGLVGTDPVPSEALLAEGCRKLYDSGYGRRPGDDIVRGFRKSHRRGVAFARRRLLPDTPADRELRILEVGAGDGYFSMGIKAVFPRARVWLVDVVEDLVAYYRDHHECTAVRGEISTLEASHAFDLVVFRDLLEHTRDPFRFLDEAGRRMAPGGRAFFITPNGREDFWLINQRFLKTGEPTLLLLNHFYYFLPETLEALLAATGLAIEEGHKFGLKQHRKGLGHRELTEFGEQRAPEPASFPRTSVRESWAHEPEAVRGHFLARPGIATRIYSALVDREREKVPFHAAEGHEFSVIARKLEARS